VFALSDSHSKKTKQERRAYLNVLTPLNNPLYIEQDRCQRVFSRGHP
jgi:hypothetical protein